MNRIKLGILAAGGIARVMVKTVIHMDSVEAYAVAARDGKRAKEFRKF